MSLLLPVAEVISLPNRTGRRDRVVADLRELALVYRWFPAFTGGRQGCRLSHLWLWQQAVDTEATLFVLEDDAQFVPDFAERLPQLMEQLPQDWDLLFLGGHEPGPPGRVQGPVRRSAGVLQTHAYLARPEALAACLADVQACSDDEDFDRVWAGLHAALVTYRAAPWLVGQHDGWSDTAARYVTGRHVPGPALPIPTA